MPEMQTNPIQEIDVRLDCDNGVFKPPLSPASIEAINLLQKASNTYQDVLNALNRDVGESLEQEQQMSNQEHFAPLDFN